MDHINFIAVGAAGVAGFVFGSIWYGVLAKAWMAAANISEEQAKPKVGVMVLTFICQLVMAFALSGVVIHFGGGMNIALLSAVFVWVGFVATTQIVNHRFQGRPWSLTLIDGGHWLGVLLVQGAVIGLLG